MPSLMASLVGSLLGFVAVQLLVEILNLRPAIQRTGMRIRNIILRPSV